MGTLLDKAILAARELPAAEQDEIAMLVLAIAGEDLPELILSDEQVASLEQSLSQADRGEFASEEDVAAVWRKHGL
ncbi:MAG: hypothetical protein Q8S29_13835 [Phreatobacter sp.]|nr:hypothetical protein [Phreatobacter sp.]